MPVKLLFLGDVVGKPGRQALSYELHRLIDRYMVDIVIANGENAAGGFGLTEETAKDLYSCGIHVLTSGNHIWDKKDAVGYITKESRLVRPANYPEGTPGQGSTIVKTAGGIKIAILNLEGRVFMNNLDCPFRVADREIERLRTETPVIFVDFHAEATSEKAALGFYLDGRVSAVVGTHTHVQTADEQVLPGGTAFITDLGMTGPTDSILGVGKAEVIEKFLVGLPVRFKAGEGEVVLCGALIEADPETGKAISIERICIS